MNESELRDAYARAMGARSAGDRTACPAPEGVQALVERDGTESARLATLDHVMQCPPCRREFELLRALREGAPERQSTRLPLRWLAAAAAIALLAVSTVLWRVDGSGPAVARSASDAVALIGPIGTVAPAEARELVWHAVPEADRYAVELFVGDSLRFAAEVRDTVMALPDSVPLNPGPHGWWVRARYPDGAERTSRFERFTVPAP